MSATVNVYCDESCYLEKDRQTAMVMGALWCQIEKTHEIFRHLREIKLDMVCLRFMKLNGPKCLHRNVNSISISLTISLMMMIYILER